jgi:hypothetical protein
MQALQRKATVVLVVAILGLTIATISNANWIIKKAVPAVVLGVLGGVGKGWGEEQYKKYSSSSSPASICSTDYGACRVPSGQFFPKGEECYCQSIEGTRIYGVTQ